MEVISREVAFTVSENASLRIPSSMSREKDTNCGGVKSSWTNVALSADSGFMPTTVFPFMSTIVADVIEIYVLLTSVPNSVRRFSSSRSIVPKLITISVELILKVVLPFGSRPGVRVCISSWLVTFVLVRRVMVEISRVVESTVSENVRLRRPKLRSRVKESNSGWVVSLVNSETWIADSFANATAFMSSTTNGERVM